MARRHAHPGLGPLAGWESSGCSRTADWRGHHPWHEKLVAHLGTIWVRDARRTSACRTSDAERSVHLQFPSSGIQSLLGRSPVSNHRVCAAPGRSGGWGSFSVNPIHQRNSAPDRGDLDRVGLGPIGNGDVGITLAHDLSTGGCGDSARGACGVNREYRG